MQLKKVFNQMYETCDIAIIGGGLMGSATAYFLATNEDFQGRIVVLERDRSYRQSASALSTSGFRQQFSTPVNIRLSQFSIEFIRQADEWLSVDGDSPGIAPVEAGYLYLGGPESVAAFTENNKLQRALGVDAILLDSSDLQQRFPWLNVDDVAIGSLGISGEGWMDGYLFMNAFRRKAQSLGVSYRYDAVNKLATTGSGAYRLDLADGSVLAARKVVIAAGTHSPQVAQMVGIELPVAPVKQTVFTFESPFSVGKSPFIFTPDGLFFRPEGKEYLVGRSIGHQPKPVDLQDFTVDYSVFDEDIWPKLAHRVAGFEQLRLRSAWAGHYDMSLYDHNPFIGAVAGVPDVFLACGFSGHGLMQSPGVGRALAELIVHGEYRSLDLSELGYQRLFDTTAPKTEQIQY